MADLVCVGELLVDFVPTVQGYSLRDVPGFEKAAGGAPANVSVGFSRLGGTSSFIGKVGDDEFGYFLEQTLERANVDTTNLYKTQKALTTLAFVSLKADGDRDFIFYRRPGADTLLEPDEITENIMESTNIVHFGSISLMQEPSRSATLKLAALAEDHQKVVSFDPNLRPALWDNLDDARKVMLQGLNWAHVLKVSEEELIFLTRENDLKESIKSLFDQYQKLILVAVTLGAEGCIFCFRDRSIQIPGFQVSAVDTTGAGDGFTAALLYKLNERLNKGRKDKFNWDEPEVFWQEVGRFANATGALVASNRGGIPSMPSGQEVQVFLESRLSKLSCENSELG